LNYRHPERLQRKQVVTKSKGRRGKAWIVSLQESFME